MAAASRPSRWARLRARSWRVLTYGAILRRLSYPVRGVRRDLILQFRPPRALRARPRLRRLARRPRSAIASLAAAFRARRQDTPGHRQRGVPITCMAARWASASACGACSMSTSEARRVLLGLHVARRRRRISRATSRATVELTVKPRRAGDHPERAHRRRDAHQPHLPPAISTCRPIDQCPRPISGCAFRPAHYLPVAARADSDRRNRAGRRTTFDFRSRRRLQPPP
mgnify:CR=1 FL=1